MSEEMIQMKIYYAPMEGITNCFFRNRRREYLDDVDCYYTPFISGNKKASLKSRELRDIIPENNPKTHIIPQILTSDAEEFVNTARRIQQFGFQEVNLNLGCPSGTVVRKKRGAGFLAYPEELQSFLEQVFSELKDMKISVKTRLGMENAEEFHRLMEIYNRYPIHELIIHPRVQKEMYRGNVHMDEFDRAFKESRCPVCYNGDIRTLKDYERIVTMYPNLSAVMIGRGLLTDPFLVEKIKGREGMTKEFVRKFYRELYDDYRLEMSGDKDVLFKMKELWVYQMHAFKDGERVAKSVLKAQSRGEFLAGIEQVLSSCDLIL
ncbi:MAG: tRNA dihydrouridine synthase [Lachnospiraceae bacterium]